jgi:hypothetical protein
LTGPANPGFRVPACVSGAITEMMAATLRPMKSGVMPADGRAALRSRVSTQIRKASIASGGGSGTRSARVSEFTGISYTTLV